jgi:hypothetical protein
MQRRTSGGGTMSIALAWLVVIAASLLSGLLEQRREARVVQKSRDRNARETFHVRVTVDRSQLGPSLYHH